MEVKRILFKSRKTSEITRIPEPVQDYMRHRFLLLPKYIDMLRCFECDGVVQDNNVRFLRVFNPRIARERGISVKTGSDLEKHPDMLLFEGYIDCQSRVYMADRRGIARETVVR